MAQDIQVVGETLSATQMFNNGPAGATISVATAISTTIPIQGPVVRVSASAATTSGSCTLAKGTVDTQQVTIINECANNIVISGNMNGSAALTIATNLGKRLIWIAADTAWFPA